MVRLTAEKSLSEWAELAEMQRMRLVTLAKPTVETVCHSPSKIPVELSSDGTHIALHLATSSRPDA